MEAEWERVWSKAWLVAGLACDVKEPGEYFVFNLGTESILVSCTDDNEIVAHYNVCQHRGARIMVNEMGWVKNFVCPYHGWEYANTGELVVVPDEGRFPQGVDCAERSLKPVRCEVWAGMVWVCMDDDAPGLSEYLGPLVDLIDPYRLGDMTLVQDRVDGLKINATQSLSLERDTDIVEAIVDFNQRDSLYQASLRVSAEIVQTSLLSFLR